jgi:hypothetical protein
MPGILTRRRGTVRKGSGGSGIGKGNGQEEISGASWVSRCGYIHLCGNDDDVQIEKLFMLTNNEEDDLEPEAVLRAFRIIE